MRGEKSEKKKWQVILKIGDIGINGIRTHRKSEKFIKQCEENTG